MTGAESITGLADGELKVIYDVLAGWYWQAAVSGDSTRIAYRDHFKAVPTILKRIERESAARFHAKIVGTGGI